MRILMAVHDFLPRHAAGTEIYAAGLARGLKERGHELLILTTEASVSGQADGSRREREFEGLLVWELAHPQDLGSLDAWRAKSFDAAVERALDEFQPELLHIQHLRFFGYGLPGAARTRGIPVVFTLHDFDLLCARFGRMRQDTGELCDRPDPQVCGRCCRGFALEDTESAQGQCRGWLRRQARRLPSFLKKPLKAMRRAKPGPIPSSESSEQKDNAAHALAIRDRLAAGHEALGACDLVVSPSHFLADRFVASGFRDPSEIVVSRNGHDARGFEDLENPHREGLRVAYFGTISEEKGLEVLLEAAATLSDRRDLQFVIHGDFEVAPEFSNSLRERASALGIELAGGYRRRDLPELMAAVDAIVVPSLWYENAPLTIAEAHMARVPVLASDLGGMAEAVSHEEDGLLFEVGKGVDLARQITRLLDEPGLYDELQSGIEVPKTLAQDAMDWERRYRSLIESRMSRVSLKERKRRAKHEVKLTVMIPTKNGGPLFARVLDRILAQRVRYPFEILCIDSGSEDETLATIRARPQVRLIEIGPASFGHGKTRQQGIEAARGELVALLSQDALPCDETLLDRMASLFEDDNVAGVMASQRPRPDADPFQSLRVNAGNGSQRHRRRLKGGERAWKALTPEDRRRLAAFDNVASMVRRADALSIPFEDRRFAEDLSWGKAVIIAGKSLVTLPEAIVIHSHHRSWRYEAKRVYLDHFELWEQFEYRTMRSLPYAVLASLRSTLRLASAALKAPGRDVAYRLLWASKAPLYAFSQNLAQYAGSRAAAAKRRGIWERVDRALREGV